MIRQPWAAGGFHLSIRQYRPWPVSWFIQLESRCRDQAQQANWQIGAAAIWGAVVAAPHVPSRTMGALKRATGHPVEEGKPAPEPPRRQPKPAPPSTRLPSSVWIERWQAFGSRRRHARSISLVSVLGSQPEQSLSTRLHGCRRHLLSRRRLERAKRRKKTTK